jgi:hypothetical protein
VPPVADVVIVALVVLAVPMGLLMVTVPYYASRRGPADGVVMHLTTPERLGSITADVPAGWVHLRPGRGWHQWLPLLGWPPRPFARRVYFYAGERWPGTIRLKYNLPHPDRCTRAVLVDVEALRAHGSGGRLYSRPIDRSAAWSGEYLGPGRIVEREGSQPAS